MKAIERGSNKKQTWDCVIYQPHALACTGTSIVGEDDDRGWDVTELVARERVGEGKSEDVNFNMVRPSSIDLMPANLIILC